MHNAVLLDDGLENLESKINEIKSEFPFMKNDLKIEKDYKMVQNTKEEDNVKESCRKNKIKERLKKSVKTIPRIRIRTIPIPLKLKSLDSQVNIDKEKKTTKRKAKVPLKLCEVMILPHEGFNVKSECLEKLNQNSENKDNDPNTLPPETDKIKNKLRKSELKALLPSLYRFQCHVCDYICKNWNSLRSHCKDSHQATPQVTCVCSKVLMTRTAVIEHRSKHTDNTTYRCEKCEKTFHRKSLLNLHIMSHLPKEEQPFVCCKCARRFHCEALLRNHERVHLPKEERLIYPCHLCHKKFSSKSAVSAHLKAVHLGERPFVCDQCGHSFTSKGILQEHLTIHSDEAPWNCSNCNKNFKTKYRLKIHMDTHRETPYQCPKCPVQLSTRRTLRMHLVIHRDTKAYQCSTCGKAFRRAKDLKNHNNLHTGKRPYTCPFCARTFANGSNCRSHKRRMHPEELQMYEASLLLKNNSSQNTISAIQKQENDASVLDVKESKDSLISASSLLFSEEIIDNRKTNFSLNMNPSSSFLSLAAARNLNMMEVGRDFTNMRHVVHQNLLSRNTFNSQVMGYPVDHHFYSMNHDIEHGLTSVPAFPGNPYIHQPLLFNRPNI